MSSIHWPVEREKAIHLLRSGLSVEVAQALGRSESWVRKWRKRFEEESWAGLRGRSRAPKHIANRYPEEIRQAIRHIRSQLEAQAVKGEGLGYIGAPAIQARPREEDLGKVPSISTIERVLHQAGMTHPRKLKPHDEVHYPTLSATQPTSCGRWTLCPIIWRADKAWLAPAALMWSPVTLPGKPMPPKEPRMLRRPC